MDRSVSPPPRSLRLTTPRLTLRPFEPAHAARMAEIQSDWEVTRMLRLAPWPATEAAMAEWVDVHGEEWRSGRAYRFAVLRADRLIGAADVDELADGGGKLGYWFERAAWGGGYASEAAHAVVRFAFEVLDREWLKAAHAADNPASGRVLQKLGFRRVGDEERFARPRGETIAYRFYRLERAGFTPTAW